MSWLGTLLGGLRPAAPPLPAAAAPASPITAALLHATRRAGVTQAELWVPVIAASCAARQIDTPLRIAAFLANVLHETDGLSVLVENLNYAPVGLLATWPTRFDAATAQRLGRTADHPADQPGIAERAYGGRVELGNTEPGDGWLFRGRGLIQLTGRANYQRFADAIGIAVSRLPALLETREGAADSAARWWSKAGCNELADTGNIAAVRRLTNGGAIGLADVQLLYARALEALGKGAVT